MNEWQDPDRDPEARQRTPAGDAFTRLLLETFRFNGGLLATGDRLTRDLGLTSARWQVLGAIEAEPLSVSAIARAMGLSRQAVQRVANDLAREGFVGFEDNPEHRRAKLVGLTQKGRESLEEVGRRQARWADGIAEGLSAARLDAAATLLAALRARLEADGDRKGVDPQ